jgi:hypothetical protein
MPEVGTDEGSLIEGIVVSVHEYRGFLPAHQLTHDALDKPVFDQRFQSLRCLHADILPALGDLVEH